MNDLYRSTITAASRVMLPTYALFFAGVGFSLILTPESRLRQTPTFRYLDTIADLTWWGAGFLAVAGGMLLCLLRHRRTWYQRLLAVAIVWMTGYTVMTAIAAFNGQTSFAAWTWPAFVAIACWASLRSITSGETGEPR